MSSADPHDVNGNRLGDRESGVPVPPGVTSQDELEQASHAMHPDPANLEAFLRTVAELTGMPLVPVHHNGQTARSFLRRQPIRIVEGRSEGGYTSVFEVICCDCGDNPYLDYSEVSARFQQLRGPYPLREGLAAYRQRRSSRWAEGWPYSAVNNWRRHQASRPLTDEQAKSVVGRFGGSSCHPPRAVTSMIMTPPGLNRTGSIVTEDLCDLGQRGCPERRLFFRIKSRAGWVCHQPG